MPYIIRPKRAHAGVGALIGAALLLGAGSSVAAAACRSNPTSQSFAQFGDNAAYSLAPGGSFEAGAPGWSENRSSIVSGNESFNIVPGTHSLAIEPFGSAVSPSVCVSSEYPSFRLFVRSLGGSSDASLNVSLRWVNMLGVTVNTPVASLQSDPSWAPTPVLKLGSSVPLWLPGTSLNVQLVFGSSGSGAWAIDDVSIDPYSR